VVVKADLIEHLRSIKDFFLLAKGEFYQTFLEEARELLSLPPTSSAEYNLNAKPLQETIIKLGLEDDERLKKFKFRLRSFKFEYRSFASLSGLIYIGDVRVSRHS